MIDERWQRIEAGWWCHPVHGGLCIERDKRWHHWPLYSDLPTRGPWRSLKAALQEMSEIDLEEER